MDDGCVGAGAGATVGKLWGIGRAMKGGIGTAAVRVDGATVKVELAPGVTKEAALADLARGLGLAAAATVASSPSSRATNASSTSSSRKTTPSADASARPASVTR